MPARVTSESLRLLGHVAHEEGAGGVAVPAVDLGPAVDRDHHALLDDTFVGDAVHDLVVDGDAGRVLEGRQMAGHADEVGRPSPIPDDLVGDGVQLQRRQARPDGLGHRVERGGGEAPGHGHLLDLRSRLEHHAPTVEEHLRRSSCC